MAARVTKTDIWAMVRRFMDAWNRHDLQALSEFYSNRIVREGRRVRLEGKEELKSLWESVLHAFPDLSVDYRHQFSVGTHGVLEWVMRGTHTGVYDSRSGNIQPSGKKVEWTGVSIWEFDDQGLILRERIYPDTAGLLEQLGVLGKVQS
ncbi:MAG: ester cyclase [Chloroflexi bacterium]|nr:ester cyclase [Chloroflexota bacterium]